MTDASGEDAIELLKLCIAWGADEAIEDAPRDRLAAPSPSRAEPRPPARSAPAMPAATAADRARAAAEAATSLGELRAAIAGFDGIGLRDTATGPVLFEGEPASGVLFVLPPPSADEDRASRLLAGETGAFLAAMLASIGLREHAMLAPLIPWRPPGDRPPSPAELAVCLPFLHRLIALSRPRLAVLMGPFAHRAMLGGERRATRGRFAETALPGLDVPLPCLPMAAAAHLRADPTARPAAWADLCLLRRRLNAEIT